MQAASVAQTETVHPYRLGFRIRFKSNVRVGTVRTLCKLSKKKSVHILELKAVLINWLSVNKQALLLYGVYDRLATRKAHYF